MIDTPSGVAGDALSRRSLLALAAAGAATTGLLGTGCGPVTKDAASAPSATANRVSSERLALPAPGGTARLGTVSLHLIDRSREDPFAPKAQPRELMVQLWYPTDAADGYPRARYMAPAAARDEEQNLGLPKDALAALRVHALASPPAAHGGRRGWPVVLYSHGSMNWRADNTAVVEELASRGYVVVTIDHPYDAIVEFPGGRLVVPTPFDVPKGMKLRGWDTLIEKMLNTRVADARFTLDALHQLRAGQNPDAEGQALPAGLGKALDLSRVGMLGFSLGGATAAQATLEDARIRACLSLDGPMPKAVRSAGLGRPILLIRSQQKDLDFSVTGLVDDAWKAFRPRGWHRDLRLANSGHISLSDIAAFCPPGGPCDKDVRPLLGTIDGHRAIGALRAYSTAFFTQHLGGRHQALLDHPSARYPEIKFLPWTPRGEASAWRTDAGTPPGRS